MKDTVLHTTEKFESLLSLLSYSVSSWLKKNHLLIGLFIVSAALSTPALADAQRIQPAPGANWQKASSKGAGVVWTRVVPGTAIKEVKLETIIDAPVEQVWSTIKQVEHYTTFMPYVDEIEVFESEVKDGDYVYHRVNPPLVSKRDYTLLIVNEEDVKKGHYYRYWTQKNEFGPEPLKGIVRLVICDGSWELTATEDGKTQATYWLYTDPGGSIPAWLANKANTSGLFDILAAIEARAKDLSWQ